jgi:hypothetical protein
VLAVHSADKIDTSAINIASSSQLGEASSSGYSDANEEDLLSKVDLIPSPKEIVSLLKKAERKEVTSGVYFRCLQAYQELAQLSDMDEAHTKCVEEAIRPFSLMTLTANSYRALLLYLQLIMLITESMPDALGDQAQKILIFIEQALRSSTTETESIEVQDREDTADSDDEEDQESQADGERSNHDPNGDLDAKDVTKLGLMETAIHLLLATLHCKVLHVSPIGAYSLTKPLQRILGWVWRIRPSSPSLAPT